MPKDKQLQLLAYHQIQKTNSNHRWLLSSPATLRDMYDILLTSVGKAPNGLFKPKPAGVNSATRKAWAEKTGSTQEAIDKWLG